MLVEAAILILLRQLVSFLSNEYNFRNNHYFLQVAKLHSFCFITLKILRRKWALCAPITSHAQNSPPSPALWRYFLKLLLPSCWFSRGFCFHLCCFGNKLMIKFTIYIIKPKFLEQGWILVEGIFAWWWNKNITKSHFFKWIVYLFPLKSTRCIM